jgi:hypothetical protein
MRTNETTEKLFTQLEGVLCPWLGVVYQWMPSNPQDLFAVTDKIHGRGFRRLARQKNYADPDWILPKWRTKSGVICPRCQIEIQALKYSERSRARALAGGPFVFCQCIRLWPSHLPPLAFFTKNWPAVLEAVTCFEEIADQLEREHRTCWPHGYRTLAAEQCHPA